jgi:lambda family phage portal protein
MANRITDFLLGSARNGNGAHPPPPQSEARPRPSVPPPIPSQRPAARNYAGASVDRLTADWLAGTLTANEALRFGLRRLRDRARDLERNDDMVKRVLIDYQANVVGHAGLRYIAQPHLPDGSLDASAKAILEAEFALWSRPRVCTMDGQDSWLGVQWMVIRRLLVDGELFIRIHRGRHNPWGIALEIVDADVIDENHNVEPADNRNRIVMGIELDRWNRPVAYHMRRDARPYSGDQRIDRVPASDVLHIYIRERPNQTRGVTWLASGMLRKRMLDAFELATVVASRVAMSKMAKYTQNPDSFGEPGASEDASGQFLQDVEAGEMVKLPQGWDLTPIEWDFPPANYQEFTGSIKRSLAAGMCSPYVIVAQDYAGVSYSSIRQDALSQRDIYRIFQAILSEHLVHPVLDDWTLMSITIARLPLPIARLAAYQQRKIQPRGWTWVDPLKEVQAALQGRLLGVVSLTQTAAEQGRSVTDVLTEIAEENALAASLGITLPTVQNSPTPASPAPPQDEDPAETTR